MKHINRAWDLAASAREAGNREVSALAWEAYGELDKARTFRQIRNQHPAAKAAHARGVRLLKRALTLSQETQS